MKFTIQFISLAAFIGLSNGEINRTYSKFVMDESNGPICEDIVPCQALGEGEASGKEISDCLELLSAECMVTYQAELSGEIATKDICQGIVPQEEENKVAGFTGIKGTSLVDPIEGGNISSITGTVKVVVDPALTDECVFHAASFDMAGGASAVCTGAELLEGGEVIGEPVTIVGNSEELAISTDELLPILSGEKSGLLLIKLADRDCDSLPTSLKVEDLTYKVSRTGFAGETSTSTSGTGTSGTGTGETGAGEEEDDSTLAEGEGEDESTLAEGETEPEVFVETTVTTSATASAIAALVTTSGILGFVAAVV